MRWLARFLFAWAVATFPVSALFSDVPVPPLTSPVTDLTETLTPDQKTKLVTRILDFERKKGSQIAVLIVPTTKPEEIEQYSIRVAEAWKIGRRGVDDGVLLLVAKEDRRVRIDVGYGLEGAIPDSIAKRIIDYHIIPHFRNRDYPQGIEAGVEAILARVQGEPLPPPAKVRAAKKYNYAWATYIVLGCVFLGLVIRAIVSRIAGVGAGAAIAFILGLIFLPVLLDAAIIAGITLVAVSIMGWSAGGRGWRSGTWGSSSGSSGSWSSGSSWGGGGGGSFGGGGASGSW